MKIEMTKEKYILIRKIIKGVIILFWIFTFITPFLILVSTYTNSISVANEYTFICWGPGMAIISPYQSLYWLFFVLFLIGFFLNKDDALITYFQVNK